MFKIEIKEETKVFDLFNGMFRIYWTGYALYIYLSKPKQRYIYKLRLIPLLKKIKNKRITIEKNPELTRKFIYEVCTFCAGSKKASILDEHNENPKLFICPVCNGKGQVPISKDVFVQG